MEVLSVINSTVVAFCQQNKTTSSSSNMCAADLKHCYAMAL